MITRSGKEGHKGWSIKYYKGLGTSTPKEAKEYFRDMKVVNYVFEEKESDEVLLNLPLIKRELMIGNNGWHSIKGKMY